MNNKDYIITRLDLIILSIIIIYSYSPMSENNLN
jgi:hypothetical protein